MQSDLNINELVKLENLPTIYEKLEVIGKWVDDGLAKLDLDNLIVDEEHKQELKNSRSEINNISKLLEDKRKAIKKQILDPYEKFEEKYNEEIKNKLNNASDKLGNAINEIEDNQKQEKEQELRQFFENYNEDYHLESIISFEDVGLNITLSASMKSLKDQIVAFFEKVANDFMAIQNGEHKEDVLFEYKNNGFDYARAVNKVNEMQKEIEILQHKLEEKRKLNEIEEKVVQNVETLVSAPVEIVEEETIECNFKVYATKSQLKELKLFLQEKGIKYE